MSEEHLNAIADVISGLAKHAELPLDHQAYTVRLTLNGSKEAQMVLPGPQSAAKSNMERELAALMTRIHYLESREAAAEPLPMTPLEFEAISTTNGKAESPQNRLLGPHQTSATNDTQSLVNHILSSRSPGRTEEESSTLLSDDQLVSVRDHVNKQTEQIQTQKALIDSLSAQVKHQQEQTEKALGGLEHGLDDIGALKRELAKHQQANLAFQKALREIGNIISNVANGDLSKKVLIHAKELDPEIATFKRTTNKMIDQLSDFAGQVSHIAKEVGSEGRLGGKAVVPGVSGIWAELTGNGMIVSRLLVRLTLNMNSQHDGRKPHRSSSRDFCCR